jgi:hypothetical protein
MNKKARTPIIEYDDYLAIELPGDGPPQERDRLSDQAMVVAYDRVPRGQRKWRLRALNFDREEWTRSGIRRWWAAHEVWFLARDQMNRPIPEICRSYDPPHDGLPAIFLCHRNTPMIPARQQIAALTKTGKGDGRHDV